MNIYFPIHIIILMVSVILLVRCIISCIKNKKLVPYKMNGGFYFLHLIVFYSVAVYTGLVHTSMSKLIGIDRIAEIWSSILRIHSIGAILLPTLLSHLERSHNGQ